MSKQEQVPTKQASALKRGLAGGSFLTAAIVVFAISLYIHIDWPVILVSMAVLLGLAVGVPAIMNLRSVPDEQQDETATCEPIIQAYRKGHSTDKLLADYEEWKRGEHSSYTRVHFGARIIDELRDAKCYEEALAVLEDLGNVKMKARERYDYDNYRAACEPQLRESIATEERRAVERARNKNLRKKR